MLIISSYLEDFARDAGQPIDTSEREIISAVVFVANLLVIALPPLHAIVKGPLLSRIASFVGKKVFFYDSNNVLGPMPSLDKNIPAAVQGEAGINTDAAAELHRAQEEHMLSHITFRF